MLYRPYPAQSTLTSTRDKPQACCAGRNCCAEPRSRPDQTQTRSNLWLGELSRAFPKLAVGVLLNRTGNFMLTSSRLTVAYFLVFFPLIAFAADRFSPRDPSVVNAANFPGADIGEQINTAYASLPARGGVIMLIESSSFSTPIVFEQNGKPSLLIGLPGDVVTLTYTGAGGTAMTFDCGTGHRMGYGVRDLTLTGPGNASNTTGVVFGGANGAEGIAFRDFKIQSFGTNLQMGSHTWLVQFEHGMVRDGGVNVLLPSGLVQAGEQIVFDHVTFADAPPPNTNSVWVQGGGQEVIFTDCSFDQAQLRIGNGTLSAAQVVVRGAHFENPNYASPGASNYDYVVTDNNPGNYLRMTESYLLQSAPAGGPSRFMYLAGGHVYLMAIGMYTQKDSPVANVAMLANGVSVNMTAFEDLSGNISGTMWGGSTTGKVLPAP